MSSSSWQLARESIRVLGGPFLETILGVKVQAQEQSGTACPILDEHGRTTFHLELRHSLDDPCAATDWYILAYLTIFLLAVSWTMRWFLLEPCADAIARKMKHPKWDRMTCRKVSMNMADAVFFTIFGYFGWSVLMPKPWLLQPLQWFLQVDEDTSLTADFKFYYLLYGARFLGASISLQFEVGRNWTTYLLSWVHHIVTLWLVLGSASCNYVRYGGVLMSIFDYADPPLLVAKSCKYLSKDENDAFMWAANRCFEIFAIIFFLTRNGVYNYVVFYGIRDLPTSDKMSPLFCRALLVALVVLQTYWGILVAKAAQGIAKTGTVEDVRENSNNDPKKDQ